MFRRVLALVAVAASLISGGVESARAQVFGTGPWSGLYFGVNGGYGRSSASDPDMDGTVAGVHAGYNLQLGSALVGIEADYTWANVSGTQVLPAASLTTSVDAMWSVRGRLGWVLASNFLLYGTAGYSTLDVAASAMVAGFNLRGTAQFDGLVIGGGGELMLTRNLLVRAEALHHMVDGRGIANGNTDSATVVRAGLSYKF